MLAFSQGFEDDAQVDKEIPAFWNEVKRRAIAEEVLEAEPNEDLELDAATLIARVKDCFNAVDRTTPTFKSMMVHFCFAEIYLCFVFACRS